MKEDHFLDVCPECDNGDEDHLTIERLAPDVAMYQAQCRHCGNVGPAESDIGDAIRGWNKYVVKKTIEQYAEIEGYKKVLPGQRVCDPFCLRCGNKVFRAFNEKCPACGSTDVGYIDATFSVKV